MSTNNEILGAQLQQRADMALSTFSGGGKGGLLQPTQANTFIDYIYDEPTLLQQFRRITMPGPQYRINRMGFDGRITRGATQDRNYTNGGVAPYHDDSPDGRELIASERAAPSTAMIELTSKELISEVRIPYEVLEDNIEQANFEDHLLREIAGQVSRDMEELALQGDTAIARATDNLLYVLDGVFKQATVHTVDNASAGIQPAVFKSGMLTLPQKYHRRFSELKHFITVADEIKYRDLVAQRATGYGDSMLTGAMAVNAFGVPVEKAPLMPATKGIFTFPQNLIFGVQREIRVETDRNIRTREIIIVVTTRVDVKIDDTNAIVIYENI